MYFIKRKDMLDKPLTKEEEEALYQSLRENIDYEEQLRRSNFNRTKQKEKSKSNEENRYLRSGYNCSTPSLKSY